VRLDAAIQFDWGSEPPVSGLPADRFSVRWTRAITAEQGTYRFTVQANHSVRVSVDGNWLYSQAGADQAETHEFQANLAAGRHVILVEYVAGTGPAIVRFNYQLVAQP
jgi:hypothetical protein